MPGLHGNEDKPPQPPRAGLQAGRILNPTLPPNRPVPPGAPPNGAYGISGGDPTQPRIPQANLGVPDTLPLQRSPVRTIIGPNGPMAIGRPQHVRFLNNGASTNGVHDANGNVSEPTTVIHGINGAPVPIRPSGPISSQQVSAKNVQPGVLALNQPPPRVGIQGVSVPNSPDPQPNFNETNPTGVSNPKKPSNSNGQEKVFQKTSNVLKREETRKTAVASPTKKAANGNGDKNKKDGNADKNKKDGNVDKSKKEGTDDKSKKDGNDDKTKKDENSNKSEKNVNGKNGALTNSPSKQKPKVNGTDKSEEKKSPQHKITPPKAQESPSPTRKKNTLSKPQESPSPTRKVTPKISQNNSPTKKSPTKSPRDASPSPTRKLPTKSPLPSPKVARKGLLTTQTSPSKLVSKPPSNLTLAPGRPLPSTNVVTSQPVANPQDAGKEGLKTADVEKFEIREKPTSEASAVFDRLLTLCRRGDWLAVETLLNHLDGLQIPYDLVDNVSNLFLQLPYLFLLFSYLSFAQLSFGNETSWMILHLNLIIVFNPYRQIWFS